MLSARVSALSLKRRCAVMQDGGRRRANETCSSSVLLSSCVRPDHIVSGSLALGNVQRRSFYASSDIRAKMDKMEALRKKRKLSVTAGPKKSTKLRKGEGPGVGALVNRMKKAMKKESRKDTIEEAAIRTQNERRFVEEEKEDEGEWEFSDEMTEEDMEQFERDAQELVEEGIEEEELLDDTDDQLKEILAIDRGKWRHERKMAHHAKEKAKIMEKRRKREEYIHEEYQAAHGVPLEEKDGLVGLAELAARQLPDDESLMEAEKREALEEAHGGRKPRNTHPQAPGGRHERVDGVVLPDKVMWPDRQVNIHMEFPNTSNSKPNDPKLAAFWLKENHQKHIPPPQAAIDMGMLTPEQAAQYTREAIKEDLGEIQGTKKKSIGERRREKRDALLPDWAKDPVAVEDITIHKAIHGKGVSSSRSMSKEGGSEQKSKNSKGSESSEANEFGVTWKDLGIGEELIKAMKTQWHITAPTEIQQLTFAPFFTATNLLIADQTGTGKTLSYLLPMLERMAQFNKKNPYYKTRGQRARSLIILPNRELVFQTNAVLQTLVTADPRFAEYRTYAMAGGGESTKRETSKLNAGVDVLISTPDRVLLHCEHEHLYLDDTTIVIFDEADTLLSSKKSSEDANSFMTMIRDVISRQKVTHAKHVQFISASATVSPPLMEFLKKEFGQSMTSIVGSGVHRSAETLRQDFLFGASGDFKKRLLFATLKKHAGKRTIIFCNTQSSVKGVTTILSKSGYSAVAMTSDMPPKIRLKNFTKFVNKEENILVSTDLASRGLDMGATVEHVILYDFPSNTIDYLHRIGRTARAGAQGVVTAFLGKGDQGIAGMIRDALAEGKSLASIKPRRPDIKTIRQIEHKIPKRLPKHIRPGNVLFRDPGEDL